ncbi:MAG: hypothetical protein WAW36_02245 [Methylovulum miyakonense]|uniref:tetratricopeptide repeat protein n=1 Tax=Methylovulum miyakonense TaxID=645578 RepID=UPI003BB58455
MLHIREPAPVYESNPVVYQDIPVAEPEPGPSPEANVEIKPIEDTGTIATPTELSPEPLPTEPTRDLLTPEQEKELAELEKAAAANNADANANNPDATPPDQTGANPSEQPTPPGQPAPAPADSPTASPPIAGQQNTGIPTPAAPVIPQPVVAPPPPPPPPFEPLQAFAPLSPVVGTLVLAANKSTEKGNVESATATIERAIRIEPRNATLFYKLALLRLKQSKPKLAEDLAKKSVLLAGNDKQLKKHSWLLIARARDMQNNPEGAKEARKKAEKL